MSRAEWRRLAAAGHEGDSATARGALDDADPVARQLALGALERGGALTLAELQHALADPHPAVRRRAATIAARHRGADLLGVMRDADPTVVEAAAWAAGEHEDVSDEVLLALCALATDARDPLVREAAVAALGAIGDEHGLDAILHGCGDKPAIRRRAVLALAPFDGPEVRAAIAAATEDRDWQVRMSAEVVQPPEA
jgi:HEAT repeat protein